MSARGWAAFHGHEDDDRVCVVILCPACAERELARSSGEGPCARCFPIHARRSRTGHGQRAVAQGKVERIIEGHRRTTLACGGMAGEPGQRLGLALRCFV